MSSKDEPTIRELLGQIQNSNAQLLAGQQSPLPTAIKVTSPTGLSFDAYGDGSDGTVELDGVTIPPWATLSGSTYQMHRTANAVSITIDAGITLDVYGWQVLCTSTFTNNGTVTDTYCGGAGAYLHSHWDGVSSWSATSFIAATAGIKTHYSETVGGGGGGFPLQDAVPNIEIGASKTSPPASGPYNVRAGNGGGVVWIAAPYLYNNSTIDVSGITPTGQADTSAEVQVGDNAGRGEGLGGGGGGFVQLVYHYVLVLGEVNTSNGKGSQHVTPIAGGTWTVAVTVTDAAGDGAAGTGAGGSHTISANNCKGNPGQDGTTGGGGGGCFGIDNTSTTYQPAYGGDGGNGSSVQSIA